MRGKSRNLILFLISLLIIEKNKFLRTYRNWIHWWKFCVSNSFNIEFPSISSYFNTGGADCRFWFTRPTTILSWMYRSRTLSHVVARFHRSNTILSMYGIQTICWPIVRSRHEIQLFPSDLRATMDVGSTNSTSNNNNYGRTKTNDSNTSYSTTD